MKNNLANGITLCRIFLSVRLLFLPLFSTGFYAAYLLCGLSDMADGIVARRMHMVSEFGSKLDSAADFVFVAVAMIKILPQIDVSVFMWIWIGVIAVIKMGTVVYGALHGQGLVSAHTVLNKITGLLLFLMPLTLKFMDFRYSAVIICTVATISAIQESFVIRKR